MSTATTEPVKHLKALGSKDMVLFTVSAILLLDTLAAAASLGASSIFWWVFLSVCFLAPFALICAEMGCAYPEQGGIYAWVKNAFGGRWASRATWGYWVNTAVWMPAIFILFAAIFKQLFYPELSLNGQILICVLLTWVSVFVNVITLNIGKWVPNIGAILKIIIFLVIILGAYFYTQDHGMANPLTFDTMKPDFTISLQYVPYIIYGMLGFELVSASSEEMNNPGRDVPRAILISSLIMTALYILGTIAVLAAIPSGEVNLVEGLMDTLALFLGDSALGKAAVLILGVAALYTFFSNAVTWSLGCNRAAAQAALDGELPALFGIEHPSRGTPVGAAVATGVVSTVTLLLYGFMSGSNEELFWSLFAFSAVIFLLPYQGMLLAFVKMRRVDADHPRPFKIPGGVWVAKLLAYLCMLILISSIVLLIYVPGTGMQWPVFIGVVITLVVGELIIRRSESH